MASSLKAASATSSDHSTAADATYGAGSSVDWDGTYTSLAANDATREISGLISSGGNSQTHRLDIKNWGFAIPSGATIDGVRCLVNWSCANSRQVDWLQVRLLKAGTPTGTNLATGGSNLTTDVDATFGGSTNLWGNTLTDSDVNASNFGVALQLSRTGGSTTASARIDYVELEVYYTESSGATGTVSITEAADTVASAGAVTVTGTSAVTEGADTASGSGAVAVSGSSAITEGADTAASAGSVAVVGSSNITESADTVAASGTVASGPVGTASITEANDTASAAGTVAVAGTAAISEAADAAASAGAVAVVGTAAITEASDTVASAGVVSSGPTGDAEITEAPDTVSGAGTVTGEGIAIPRGGGGPDEDDESERHYAEKRKFIERQKKPRITAYTTSEPQSAAPAQPIAAVVKADAVVDLVSTPRPAPQGREVDEIVADLESAVAETVSGITAIAAARTAATARRRRRLKALLLLAAAA